MVPPHDAAELEARTVAREVTREVARDAGAAVSHPRLHSQRGIDSRIDSRLPLQGARRLLMNDTVGLVLAGGRGTRLGALTARRAKPAVPIGGRHRIIDFTLSNCVNSGLRRIGVLTQYMGQSLLPHIDTWNGESRHSNIRTLPSNREDGYSGTADAVYQNRDVIRSLAPSYVMVLAADHVYRMDYAAMLEDHLQRGAQLTVGCIEVPLHEASGFGVMEIDADNRIRAFVEKPQQPQPMPDRSDCALASMGIYVFDTAFLLGLLDADAADPASAHDFGKDIVPRAVAAAGAFAHSYRDPRQPWRPGYWRDVGTIDAYWRTNLELAGAISPINLDDRSWPIPGTAGGVRILQDRRRLQGLQAARDGRIQGSVLFPEVQVGADSVIENSVLLPGARVGAGSVLRNTIVDEGCEVPAGSVIGLNADHDRRRHAVTPAGVTLVSH
jgi:glucose-1-phosphate adenylyltransferase